VKRFLCLRMRVCVAGGGRLVGAGDSGSVDGLGINR
jgi:hypothetical protein